MIPLGINIQPYLHEDNFRDNIPVTINLLYPWFLVIKCKKRFFLRYKNYVTFQTALITNQTV